MDERLLLARSRSRVRDALDRWRERRSEQTRLPFLREHFKEVRQLGRKRRREQPISLVQDLCDERSGEWSDFEMVPTMHTRNLTLDRSHSPDELFRRSTILPGVATTTCGRLPSSRACAMMSMPPTTTAVRRFSGAPSTANCSEIWNASSLHSSVSYGRAADDLGYVPSRGEDESEDAIWIERELLQDRQSEGDGLSGTRLRVSYAIPTLGRVDVSNAPDTLNEGVLAC